MFFLGTANRYLKSFVGSVWCGAVKLQGLRARAQAGSSLGAGTAVERRQRQEIEGLKATIERAKLDAEAARKKARASERR